METIGNLFKKAKLGKSGCLFCNPFEEMVLFEGEFFRVLADTFPLVPGHMMIATKDHYGCAGEVPEAKLDELSEIKNRLKTRIQLFDSEVCFYEHGRAGGCTTVQPGLKCEHFHLHCLPIRIDITDRLKNLFPFHILPRYQDIAEAFFESGDYLFFETNEEEKHFFPAGNIPVAPHLLRTFIAEAVGKPNLADWECYDNFELLKESYEKIHRYFPEILHKESLCAI